MEQNTTDSPAAEVKTSKSSFNFHDNPKSLLIFIVGAFAILAIITTLFMSVRDNGPANNNPNEQEKKVAFEPLAPNSVVYGFWGNDTSHINSVDLNSGEIKELAILSSNIKKVTITSPSSMVFINGTDIRDHGSEIATFDANSKLTSPLITASQGYGIDDYVISPNKRFIAIWEVSIPENQNLDMGKSRVYAIDLQNPGTKNLIYDENIPDTIFATYPLAITDSGEIFLDRFQPNTSAGWANGMFVSDFAGNKTEIEAMPAGTYGTQPQLSPDGRYLAFAGYDGTRGAGTAAVGSPDGFRQAILSPNTIEILDTATKTRTKLTGLVNTNRYPDVKWDKSGKVFYSQISRDVAQNGYYLYDLATSTPQVVNNTGDAGQTNTYSIITSLDNGKFLGGQVDTSTSALGNLGNSYAQAISEMGVYDSAGKLTPLSMDQGLMQYIDVYAAGYFAEAASVGQAGIGSDRRATDQLQLQSFVIKPTLEPVRTTQQSSGRCRDVAAAMCNSILGTNFTGNDAKSDGGTGNAAFDSCFDQEWKNAKAQKCNDSPLYLYGEKGTSVSVKVGTDVSNSNAPYNGSYAGKLNGKGGIEIKGNEYPSLDFNYVNAIKRLPRLEYGRTVTASEVDDVIREYGQKLGLNSTEINDTVKKIGQINSEYVFVSFFDDATSKAILPIDINPAPDVYRNVVFYLKPTEAPASYKEPEFTKYPERRGFTAVEVSYLLDD